MDSWKAEVRRVRREKIRRKKMQVREKVGKSRNTVFFQWFVAPEGRKVGSLKRRVRSQLARWEMKNCTPLWREAHLEVKMQKAPEERTTFGSWDVVKVHAVVARSTFRSQNVQNTPFSDHFWKLRCWKSARRCGAKHISKSKCTKHTIPGPLLEVEMSKKCTPLWREAHFEVKSVKNWRSRTTFGGSDVEKVSKKCTPLWREAHFEVKLFKTLGVRTIFGGSDVASLQYTTLKDITLHYTTLHNTTTTTTTAQLHNYTPLHSTTLNYTTLHYAKLHYTTLHYTTLHSTTLHYTTLHYLPLPSTTLHYITLHYTPLHYNYTTTLHYTKLHYTHYTTLHYTTLHYTTLHYTTLHYLPLHFTTLHYTTLQLHNYTPLH